MFRFPRRLSPLFSSLTAACLLATPFLDVHAGLNEVDRERLAAQIEAASTNLDVDRIPSLDQSKQAVLRRMDRARNFFSRKTSPENSAAWMEYLQFEPLAEAIKADTSVGEIGREALALKDRLVGTVPGLELTVLRQLRESLDQLIAAIRFRDTEKSVEALSRQLRSLAERIRQLDRQPSPDDAAAISAVLEILKAAGQADDVIAALRNTFSQANVAVLVGEPMVQTAIAQNVDQTRPVNDCILGTRIIGTATMNGMVTANLMPSVGAARMNVALTGHVTSNNIGYNGPVRLRTSGSGHVNAWRTVNINQSGISLEPVYVDAAMHTQINQIEHHLNLVRKIARKRAAQQKPEADRIANQKFRSQVGEQFASQTNEQAAIEIPDLMKDVRPVLLRLSLVEPTQLWGSTDEALYIDATLRRDDQIATVTKRPSVSGVFAAAVQIHESAVNNAATPVLAGRTIKEAQLDKLMEAVNRDSPDADNALEGEADDPFEIDFARLRPVIFEARDQTLRVGVRGTRFAQGGRELKRPMEITATYRAETRSDGTVMLARDGEVGVDFPGDRRLSVSETGLRATIQSKFSKVFPATLLDRPLTVPETSQLEAIRGDQYWPRTIDALHGWLTIAVR